MNQMIVHAEPSAKSSAAEPAQARTATSAATVGLAPSPAVQRLAELGRSLNASPAVVAQRALGEKLSAASVTQRAPANRTGLPDALKAGVEALSGHSLDDVRVHRNSGRPSQLQAHAYAQGTDIHLAPGQERHLPHEAWHVAQQKQGRVQPTMQLKDVSVNDDHGLEREADVMGARAANLPASVPLSPPRSSSLASPGGNAPMQMIFVVRNGQMVWEEPYAPQDGDQFPEDFSSNPSVLMDKGTKDVLLDRQGNTSSQPHGRPVPPHKGMQTTREQQGASLRAMLKQNPGSIKTQSAELAKLAETLEALAPHALPKNHKQKVEKLIKGGSISGADFRGIHPAQDEITQSQATTHFLQGFRTPSGTGVDPHHADLEEYAANMLRLMSSMRIPTASVVAPIRYGGTTTGQQHPTDDDQPKLEGGGSGHSYADRNRVEAQIRTFSSTMNVPGSSPNAVLLATTLSAAVTTLSTMSAPTTASNIASFNLTRQNLQVQEREALKAQTNAIAAALGYPVAKNKQARDAPWVSSDEPTSPIRVDPSELVDDTATVTTGIQQGPDPEVQRLALAVQHTAARLWQALPDPQLYPDHAGLQQFAHFIAHLHDAAGQVNTADPQNVNILYGLHRQLNQLFRDFNGLVQRPVTANASVGNPDDPAGQRLPSLEQFFAECGQMAAHNALVLAHFPDLGDPNVVPALFNQQHLAGLGGFENFVAENQIRDMLAAAHRPDIPVIGNLGQAAAVAGLVLQQDWQTLWEHDIGAGEQQGAQSLIDFAGGATQSVVMVVNTTGDEENSELGNHWISLRVTRQLDGALGIQYLDSLQAPSDYTQLFQSLRAFLAQVPQQPVHDAQVQEGGTGSGGGTYDDFDPDRFFADFDDVGAGQTSGQTGPGTFGGGGFMEDQQHDQQSLAPMDLSFRPGTPDLFTWIQDSRTWGGGGMEILSGLDDRQSQATMNDALQDYGLDIEFDNNEPNHAMGDTFDPEWRNSLWDGSDPFL